MSSGGVGVGAEVVNRECSVVMEDEVSRLP